MKNMFVNSNNTFEVNVCTGTDKNGTSVISEKLSLDKDVLKDTSDNKIFFRKPGYGDNVQILSAALKVVDGGLQLDPTLLRYERFCTLIKSWDFKDENGKVLEVTRQNINALDPDIANFIIEKLEEKLAI